MNYLAAFFFGGLLCAIAELLILATALTPARILVGYVCAGVILGAVGAYAPFKEIAHAGATVPLTGFGYLLARGVCQAVSEQGLLGVLTGGFQACAGGLGAVIFFGFLFGLAGFGYPDGKRKSSHFAIYKRQNP